MYNYTFTYACAHLNAYLHAELFLIYFFHLLLHWLLLIYCVCVCMCVCMWMYVCVTLCVWLCMFVCVCVCVCVRDCVCVCVAGGAGGPWLLQGTGGGGAHRHAWQGKGWNAWPQSHHWGRRKAGVNSGWSILPKHFALIFQFNLLTCMKSCDSVALLAFGLPAKVLWQSLIGTFSVVCKARSFYACLIKTCYSHIQWALPLFKVTVTLGNGNGCPWKKCEYVMDIVWHAEQPSTDNKRFEHWI